MAEAVDAGHGSWSPATQQATAQAVFDSLFRLGRLQPLVDDDRIENIVIVGHDNVQLELVDGTLVDRTAGRRLRSGADRLPRLPCIAQRGQRSFVLRGPAEPAPEARRRIAPGRGRLGDDPSLGRDPASPADAGHAGRPRRARHDDADRRPRSCEPRCGLGARSSSPARRVPGKTTLVRALCAEIDALEAIGTFETEYELHLHELGRHKVVHRLGGPAGIG